MFGEMIMQNDKIELPSQANYKVGAVTYQVIAFFDAEKPSIQNKVKQLLIGGIKNNSICTFANGQDSNVE